MGVQRLKSYIESNKNFLRNLPFRDRKLIIDGCNLYYNLYFHFKLDQIHGGDYDTFEDLVREFFQNLKDCAIHPYVVLDGGADHTDKKFETLKTRNQSKIKQAYNLSIGQRGSVLPLLIKTVLRQTLHKLKVPHVQCFEEADWEIAALAKEWNCPILSDDSDFYIFDLPAGTISIQDFDWKHVRVDKNNKKYIQTKHFTVDKLCASFNSMNKDLLPVFASILGNDYVRLQNITDLRWEVHSVCGGGFAQIDGLLTWLSKFSGPEAAIDDLLKLIKDNKEKDIAREALFKGIKEYKLVSGSLAQFFHTKTVAPTAYTGPLRALPLWTLKPLLEGEMGSFIVDILLLKRVFMIPQVEDFDLPSSSETSCPIRQVLYGLVLLGEQQTSDKLVAAAKASTGTNKCYVTEYDRKGITLTSSKVEAIETKVKEGLRLETLWKEPHALRLHVLLDTLGASSVTFSSISPHLQLQVLVTRYWLVNAQPQPSQLHLWGLLLGMVYGKFSTVSNTKTDPVFRLRKLLIRRGRIYLDHELAHLYSQWQSCMLWSLRLNHLLCHPLPDPECARLYRGTLVHQVVRELESGVTPESLLAKGSSAEQLFRQLRDAVLSLVDEDVIRRISTRHERRAVVKTQTDNRCKNQSVDDLSSCFEHLNVDDIEEYDDDDVVNGKGGKAKDHTTDMLECPYSVRTRHKAKARNADYRSKKFARRCFDLI